MQKLLLEIARCPVLEGDADEQCFFHQGSAVRLHVFSDSAGYQTIDIGDDLDQLKAAYPAQARIIDQLSRAG